MKSTKNKNFSCNITINKNKQNHNMRSAIKKNNNCSIMQLIEMEECTPELSNDIFENIYNDCRFNCQLLTKSCQINTESSPNRYSPKTIDRVRRDWSRTRFFKQLSLREVLTFVLMLLLISFNDLASAALRNVNLFIEPPAVRRGQTVTLRCNYILEGAPLYSVKFYRGNLEFFRFTSGEYPSTKFFPYPGIKVDDSVSNATQVVIRNVGFGLSGNFSCEVTADAPLYSTATAHALMQVVEFPEKRPQLFTEHSRYEPGDVLRANCSTQPSRPRAELRFTINNMPVSSGETQYIRTVDNLIASRLSLKLQLQAVHFAVPGSNSHMMNTLSGIQGSGSLGIPYNSVNTHGSVAGTTTTGGLVLRCTAQIGDLYQEYKEIELGTPQRDPVPARVILSSTSSLRNFFESYFSSSSSAYSTKMMASCLEKQILMIILAIGAITTFHRLQISVLR